MKTRPWMDLLAAGSIALLLSISACGGGGGEEAVAPVTIAVAGPNDVSTWHETGANTINAGASTTGTAAEQRPNASLDLATMHLAIYDALMALDGAYRPYAIVPTADATGALAEAAISGAAFGVLSGLYPSRVALYQPTYDRLLAAMADGPAKTKGLALGAEVAQRLLALRGDDGRMVALPAYVPGTGPGQFRGTNPVNRNLPATKPLALLGASQFRAPAPVALASAAYASDFEETRTLGGAASTTRSAAQLDQARFHTEAPPRFWPRNLRNFAMTSASLPEQARLLAMVLTVQADAEIACFDSKYAHSAWRPFSAIVLAETDGNSATTPDPTWTPVVPTPNHPEYPAAHSCVAGAVMEALKAYFRTDQISFTFDSTVTGNTHSFTSTQAFVDEIQIARIAGGMHFRFSTVAGDTLGRSVAQWILDRNFRPR